MGISGESTSHSDPHGEIRIVEILDDPTPPDLDEATIREVESRATFRSEFGLMTLLVGVPQDAQEESGVDSRRASELVPTPAAILQQAQHFFAEATIRRRSYGVAVHLRRSVVEPQSVPD